MSMKVGAFNRLEAVQASLMSDAERAIQAGNFELACRIMRTSHGIFQSSNAADRSKETRTILEKMEQNTEATVNSHTGTRAKITVAAKVGAGFVQAAGGVVGFAALGGIAAAATVSQSISYAGQGFSSAVGAVESTVQGEREGLNGKKAMLQNELDDTKAKVQSAKDAGKTMRDQIAQAQQEKHSVFAKMGG